MTYDLAFIGALIGIAVFCAVVVFIRQEHEARLGRMLLQAAGGESGARMAIESANLDRLLERKFDGELRETRRPSGHRLPANVTRIAPRILNRGRKVNFEPDGAA